MTRPMIVIQVSMEAHLLSIRSCVLSISIWMFSISRSVCNVMIPSSSSDNIRITEKTLPKQGFKFLINCISMYAYCFGSLREGAGCRRQTEGERAKIELLVNPRPRELLPGTFGTHLPPGGRLFAFAEQTYRACVSKYIALASASISHGFSRISPMLRFAQTICPKGRDMSLRTRYACGAIFALRASELSFGHPFSSEKERLTVPYTVYFYSPFCTVDGIHSPLYILPYTVYVNCSLVHRKKLFFAEKNILWFWRKNGGRVG